MVRVKSKKDDDPRVQALRKKGRYLTDLILEYVDKRKERGGVSIYQLADLCGVSVGAISGALPRFKNEVQIVEKKESGKNKKLFYPKNFEIQQKIPGYFEIHKNDLGKQWGKKAIGYVISNNQYLILPKEISRYKNSFKNEIKFEKDKDKIKFVLPDPIFYYYELQNKGVQVTPTLNQIKINILNEKKEKPKSGKTYLKNIQVIFVEDEYDVTYERLRKIFKQNFKYYETNSIIDKNYNITLGTNGKKNFRYAIIDWVLLNRKVSQKEIKGLIKKYPKTKFLLITANTITTKQILGYIRAGFYSFFSKSVKRLGEKITNFIEEDINNG